MAWLITDSDTTNPITRSGLFARMTESHIRCSTYISKSFVFMRGYSLDMSYCILFALASTTSGDTVWLNDLLLRIYKYSFNYALIEAIYAFELEFSQAS